MELTLTTLPSAASPKSAEARHSLQVSAACYQRLTKLAEMTGLSRTQILEYLIESAALRTTAQRVRAAGLRPRLGRRKQSIFTR